MTLNATEHPQEPILSPPSPLENSGLPLAPEMKQNPVAQTVNPQSASVEATDSAVSNTPPTLDAATIHASPLGALLFPQVLFKSKGSHLELILPAETDSGGVGAMLGANTPKTGVQLTWIELWQQLKQRLNGAERFWEPDTDVHLVVQDRLLDGRQLQAIAEALSSVQLRLKRIQTSRRQTAVVAATAGYSVDQVSDKPSLQTTPSPVTNTPLADPLYVQMTLRSGAEVRHPGTVIILGDVNPGSTIIADGDILVWGRLRGVAHAGANGNARCLIAALKMEPTQLRIAQVVARAPSELISDYHPEVAYVTPKGICIMGITEFSKNPFLS